MIRRLAARLHWTFGQSVMPGRGDVYFRIDELNTLPALLAATADEDGSRAAEYI